MTVHGEATEIHAVPAEAIGTGFRLLVMREIRSEDGVPAFAFIEQRLLRYPERRNRHGVSFALTYRPEIMDWLIAELGRPSQRNVTGEAQANARWPRLSWFHADRVWPDGLRTVEWFADICFPEDASRAAFEDAWRGRLMGRSETG